MHTLTGRLKKGLVITLVKDQDLEKAKSDLDEVITSSLYSVQKGKLVNLSVLRAADYEATHNNYEELIKFGGIEYNGSKKLSKEEIRKLRMTPGGDKDVTSDIEKQFAKPQTSKKSNIFFVIKSSNNPADQTLSVDKTANTKKSPQGVAMFLTRDKIDPFSKNQSKPTEIKQEIIEKPQNETEKSNPLSEQKLSKQRGFANFLTKEKTDPFAKKKPKAEESEQNIHTEFKKQSSKSSAKAKTEKLNGNHEKSKSVPDELKIDDFSEEEDLFKVKETKPKKSNSTNTKYQNSAKKRKRIEWISSSSEDEEEENEVVDMIPSSPPRKRIQDSPVMERNKRMKKVLKKKTFMDNEGCMVTEKYYELEECDEARLVATGNNIQPEKSPIKKKTPSVSTAAQPKKQKQASIMGFFKKK